MKEFNVTEGSGNLLIHIKGVSSGYNISYDHGTLIFENSSYRYIIPEENAQTIYTKYDDPATSKRVYLFDNIRSIYRDIIPNDFGVSNITEAEQGSSHFTEEITLAGINDKVVITVPNGVIPYVNGVPRSNGVLVDIGDVIKFEITASSDFDTELKYNIAIGDLTKEFVIRTKLGVLPTCKAWRDAGYTTDGVYRINPTGNEEFNALCDMTKNDGGWTLVYKIADASSMKSTGLVGSFDSLSTSVISDTYNGKLADTTIRAIYTDQYRVEQWTTATMFGRFININSYGDNIQVDKRTGSSYQTIANNYNTGHDGYWNYGFSAWGSSGQIITQLNYRDSRLGSHIAGSYSSAGDAGCTSSGGCHTMVWVR
jgi:hypothetical protein